MDGLEEMVAVGEGMCGSYGLLSRENIPLFLVATCQAITLHSFIGKH